MRAGKGAPEREVLRAVMDWLKARGFLRWRVNSGALETPGGRHVRFGAKGMADVIALGPEGRAIFVECKRERGGRLSAEQAAFLETVNRQGGLGIVVNSTESLERQLREAGII